MAETFEDLRPLLFSIAYRMLGSVAEAEDIVQEAFLRYHRALLEHDAEIESPKAYLSAVATRLAIDHLRSARVRKESYVGEWLPEPLLTDEHAAGRRRARRGRRLALDGVPAPARAALAGRARRLPAPRRLRLRLRRGRRHRRQERGQLPPARRARRAATSTSTSRASRRRGEQRERLAERFFDAVEDGDVDGLVELLAADVVVYGDGGGTSPSWRAPDLRPRPGRSGCCSASAATRASSASRPARRDQRPAGRDVPRLRTAG